MTRLVTLPRALPAPLDDPWPGLDSADEIPSFDRQACLLGYLLWAAVVAAGLALGAGLVWYGPLRRLRCVGTR